MTPQGKARELLSRPEKEREFAVDWHKGTKHHKIRSKRLRNASEFLVGLTEETTALPLLAVDLTAQEISRLENELELVKLVLDGIRDPEELFAEISEIDIGILIYGYHIFQKRRSLSFTSLVIFLFISKEGKYGERENDFPNQRVSFIPGHRISAKSPGIFRSALGAGVKSH